MVNDIARIATWNIWWRYGEWQDRQAAIHATLKRIDADVVALNEVWEQVDAERQADGLAEELGMHVVSRCLPDEPGLASGNAILSRWPIRRTDVLLLSNTRCVLHAELDSPHGPLSVFATHLTWRPDDGGKRQTQLHEALKFIRDKHRSVLPPILLGDLNAVPDSDELRMLTGRKAVPVPPLVFLDLWEQVGDGTAGYTWDRSNVHLTDEPWPSRRLDYVLAGLPTSKPVNAWYVPLRCWLEGSTPVDGIQPSDHYAVVAELRCVVAPSEVPQKIEKLGVDHVAR